MLTIWHKHQSWNQSKNAINLDDLSKFLACIFQHFQIINLNDSSNFTTPMKDNNQPTFTMVTSLKSTKVKKKQTLVFMLIIKAIDEINITRSMWMPWTRSTLFYWTMTRITPNFRRRPLRRIWNIWMARIKKLTRSRKIWWVIQCFTPSSRIKHNCSFVEFKATIYMKTWWF